MSEAQFAVGSPPIDADAVLLADWLELVAFFNSNGIAQLDAIDNALSIQEETSNVDNAEEDAEVDDRRSLIEEEIEYRSKSLGSSYPFELSDDGEELAFKAPGDRDRASFYIFCLIMSHVSRSPILEKPPTAPHIHEGRKRQFQTFATLAVAGHARGPAISFGFPRAGSEALMDAVRRCCDLSQTGVAREAPGQEASESPKDGGMDVIAWTPAVNSEPPPAVMYFGQAASGFRWREKSALAEVEVFLRSFFAEVPACNYAGVTVIPFRIDATEHRRLGRRHGCILDRTRAPKAAHLGVALAKSQTHDIDEYRSTLRLDRWLVKYRSEIRALAA